MILGLLYSLSKVPMKNKTLVPFRTSIWTRIAFKVSSTCLVLLFSSDIQCMWVRWSIHNKQPMLFAKENSFYNCYIFLSHQGLFSRGHSSCENILQGVMISKKRWGIRLESMIPYTACAQLEASEHVIGKKDQNQRYMQPNGLRRMFYYVTKGNLLKGHYIIIVLS